MQPNSVASWYPSPEPRAVGVDLSLVVTPFVTGWNRAITRPPEVKVTRPTLVEPTPRVIRIGIGSQRIATRSFLFGQPCVQPASAVAPAEHADPAPTGNGDRTRTRVKPPDDVIRLEDRLQYVLQPPLESLLDSRSLSFPFRPFPYQWEGIAFLYPRHAAVLADEMGLGKTMQAITTVRLLLHAAEVRSVLLVCPKPLISNWQREFQVWAPEIPLLVIDGDQTRRRWQWELTGVPVKLANYELLHRDREIFDGFARSHAALDFDLVILDESQRIKNHASATSAAARLLRRRRAWALTGTPVENSPEDLVGIFEFLVSGHLSSDMAPRQIGRAVRNYVLRRTKDQVLTDLPPKLYRDAELELTPEQRQTYQLANDEGVLRLTEMGEGVTIQHVFELILRLKQICNFDPASGTSAKLERLEADLEEVAASGRKALIFSQWVDTIERLSGELRRFRPLEFHGRIPRPRREAVLREFCEEPGSRGCCWSATAPAAWDSTCK